MQLSSLKYLLKNKDHEGAKEGNKNFPRAKGKAFTEEGAFGLGLEG